MRRTAGLGTTIALAVTVSLVGLGGASCGGSSTSMPPAAASAQTSTDSADFSVLIEAENAAIYAYGVIGAHLAGSSQNRAVTALHAHERLRDGWIQAARDADQDIPAAAIAYDLPIDVRDAGSARALSIEIEKRLIAVYASAGEIAAEARGKAEARLARESSAS